MVYQLQHNNKPNVLSLRLFTSVGPSSGVPFSPFTISIENKMHDNPQHVLLNSLPNRRGLQGQKIKPGNIHCKNQMDMDLSRPRIYEGIKIVHMFLFHFLTACVHPKNVASWLVGIYWWIEAQMWFDQTKTFSWGLRIGGGMGSGIVGLFIPEISPWPSATSGHEQPQPNVMNKHTSIECMATLVNDGSGCGFHTTIKQLSSRKELKNNIHPTFVRRSPIILKAGTFFAWVMSSHCSIPSHPHVCPGYRFVVMGAWLSLRIFFEGRLIIIINFETLIPHDCNILYLWLAFTLDARLPQEEQPCLHHLQTYLENSKGMQVWKLSCQTANLVILHSPLLHNALMNRWAWSSMILWRRQLCKYDFFASQC